MKRNNINLVLRVTASVLLLLAIISFFFTSFTYEDMKYKLSNMVVGSGAKGIISLMFFSLIIGLLSSIMSIFIENKYLSYTVILIGLVFGIMLFFTLNLALPSPVGFKLKIAPILGGISAILGSFISLIAQNIKKSSD